MQDTPSRPPCVSAEGGVWACSGLPEFLQRAVDLCERGSVAAACTAALNLLDFHVIVKRAGSSPRAAAAERTEGEGEQSGATNLAVQLLLRFHARQCCCIELAACLRKRLHLSALRSVAGQRCALGPPAIQQAS